MTERREETDYFIAEVNVSAVILEDNTTQASKTFEILTQSIQRISKLNKIKILPLGRTIKQTRAEVEKLMSEENKVPDWVLCDVDLSDKGAGVEVAKTILKRKYPTDVLLYTQSLVFPVVEDIQSNRYCNVATANRDQLDGAIDILVWRSVTRLADPDYLRGIMLSRAAETESLIDECLVQLFGVNKIQTQLRDSFRWGLLRSEGYGQSVKFKVLNDFLKDRLQNGSDPKVIFTTNELSTIKGNLERIFKTRNIVAHGIAYSDEKGGLVILNRMRRGDADGNSSQDYTENIKRDEIKQYLHLCYLTEEGLRKLLTFLVNKSDWS